MPVASAAKSALAALAILLGLLAPAAAQQLKGAEADAAVQQAAATLARVQTLEAGFDLLTPSGINKGRIFVDRPRSAMRMQFAAPLNHLILVDGPQVMFLGGDGTQIETATGRTPLAFLMDPEAALRDKIDVLQVERRGAALYIALAERGNREAGQVILHFEGDGAWRLKEWGMYDAEGGFSQTRLRDVKTGVELDPALFRAPQ